MSQPDRQPATPSDAIIDDEQQRIDRIAVNAVLDQLSRADRELLWLQFAYRRPFTYTGSWPPTPDDIGYYIGHNFGKRRLSQRTIQARTQAALRVARSLVRSSSDQQAERPPKRHFVLTIITLKFIHDSDS